MTTAQHRYLIVGGAPRSGTTSLYRYLADHPDTCASSIKETRFFLDRDYPLPSAARFNGRNLAEYEKFFAHCLSSDSSVRVEASPDYLYSRMAVEIADILPNAKVVFILRDPVKRMVSWYQYAKQRGLLARELSFEAYVLMQLDRRVEASTPVHLRALDQCCYARYLTSFQRVLGPRCLVLRFEQLKSNPLSVMIDLAAAAGLDSAFYRSYEFPIENASHAVRSGRLTSAYSSLRRAVAMRLHGSPKVASALRLPNRALKRILSVNFVEPEEFAVPDQLRNIILKEAGVVDDIPTGAAK